MLLVAAALASSCDTCGSPNPMPNPDGSVVGLPTGAACTADSQCSGSTPDCIDGLYPLTGLDVPDELMTVGVALPGGYCSTVAPCASDTDCGDDGQCFRPLADITDETLSSLESFLGDSTQTFKNYGACLLPCTTNADCRPGYACEVPIAEFLGLVPGARMETYCVGSACGVCGANAVCDATGETPTCTCAPGFAGDGQTCVPSECPALTIDDGTVTPGGNIAIGATASYGCNTGFTLVGASSRECQANGTWSGTAPACVALVGGCAANPCAYGTCSSVGGDDYTCACDEGYAGANCDMPVVCSGLVAPLNGSLSSTSAMFGSSVTYTCGSGYVLAGSATRTCQADGSFAGTAPTCVPVDCGTLSAPTNGTISATGTSFGATAAYACNGGFVLTPAGTGARSCQADGSWSGAAPTCEPAVGCASNPCQNGATCNQGSGSTYTCTCTPGWQGANCATPVSCDGLVAPSHGAVSSASAFAGQSVTYSCTSGYTLSGNAMRTCQNSGDWDGSTPSCAPVSCASLLAPSNGSVNPATSVTFGMTATYACASGYVLTGGNTTRSCQADMSWSGIAPTCTPVACPTLTAPTNGAVTPASGTYGVTAMYSCGVGYALSMSGTASRTCGANGAWSGTAPTCEEVSGCDDMPCQNGSTCTPGSGLAYSCACVAGWTGTNCDVAITCSGLVAPTNGTVTAQSATYGNSVMFACNAGYDVAGSATLSCQLDGNWSGPAPTCAPVTCSGLVAPTNGSVTPTSTTYGLQANYSCGAGYTLMGSSTRTCQADMSWSGTAPTCVPVACPTLAPPTNGTLSSTTGSFGQTTMYACNANYMLSVSGTPTRTCQANGQWDGTAPTCVPVPTGCDANPCQNGTCMPGSGLSYTCQCAAGWLGTNCDMPVTCTGLSNPTNGNVSAPSATFGNGVSYTCNAGYSLVGQPTRACLATGMWAGSAPTCAPVTCSGLVAPTNGTVTPTSTTYGLQATYACSAGYTLTGNGNLATRTCQADTTWSGSAPSCTPVTCSGLVAPANGSVAPTSTTFGNAATYSCNGGYMLSGNGGSATRSCLATTMWSGTAPTCVAVSGCASNPCQNGTCNPGAGSAYTCTCATGWTGANCDMPVTCSGLTNPTNGTVSSPSATYGNAVNYTCSPGYTRVGAASLMCLANGTWDASAPTCAAVTCSGATAPANGTVSAPSTTYPNNITYACNAGFVLTGSATRACQAGGTFSGTAPTCTPITCSAVAPTNGGVSGTTIAYGANATYTCNAGYMFTGGSTTRACGGTMNPGTLAGTQPTCGPLVNGCTPTNPCQNGSTCAPGAGTAYTCACTPGWTGTNCQTAVQCTGATAPANGTVSAAVANAGNSVLYACNTGYTITGTASRACGVTGTWATAAPTCPPVTCSGAVAPNNGTVSAASATYTNNVTYTCNAGFVLGGSATATCQANGTFSSGTPSCTQIACAALTAPSNGSVTPTSVVNYGGTAMYSCGPGYMVMGGTNPRTCGGTANPGTWSGTAPTCVPMAPTHCIIEYRAPAVAFNTNCDGTTSCQRVNKSGIGSFDNNRRVGPARMVLRFQRAADGRPVAGGTAEVLNFYNQFSFNSGPGGATVTTTGCTNTGNGITSMCVDPFTTNAMTALASPGLNTGVLNAAGTQISWSACMYMGDQPGTGGFGTSDANTGTGAGCLPWTNHLSNLMNISNGIGEVPCSGILCGLVPDQAVNSSWKQYFNAFALGAGYSSITMGTAAFVPVDEGSTLTRFTIVAQAQAIGAGSTSTCVFP